jgi:hypothetical protein
VPRLNESAAPEDAFAAAVERVRSSAVLGRSAQLQRLFDFLVDCQARQRVPKEVEVAVDGFGRGTEFDVAQDALVRVSAHKLRKRLEEFYRVEAADAAQRLTIPRGEYRLALEPAAAVVLPVTGWRRWLPVTGREKVAIVACLLLAALCVVLLTREMMRPRLDARVAAAHASPLWAPLLTDDLPIQVVLGDYYIFGERDDQRSAIRRLVRDFDVNSRHDLEQRFLKDPSLMARYADLNLGYLPTSSAYALREVLPILMSSGKRVTLTLASELDPAAIKNSHIVYIGYLSALGMLQDIVFAGSRFSFGGSFDELIDSQTGEAYVSEAGEPHKPMDHYRDYAYLATFAGPGGNQHLIIAGARDTALTQAAEVVADPNQLQALTTASKQSHAFEALYEVHGVNGANVESRLIGATALDPEAMWRDVMP